MNTIKIQNTEIRAKVPEALGNFRLESVLPGEQALRFHDIFIVKSYNEMTKEHRYDITFHDSELNNHAVLASIWIKK